MDKFVRDCTAKRFCICKMELCTKEREEFCAAKEEELQRPLRRHPSSCLPRRRGGSEQGGGGGWWLRRRPRRWRSGSGGGGPPGCSEAALPQICAAGHRGRRRRCRSPCAAGRPLCSTRKGGRDRGGTVVVPPWKSSPPPPSSGRWATGARRERGARGEEACHWGGGPHLPHRRSFRCCPGPCLSLRIARFGRARKLREMVGRWWAEQGRGTTRRQREGARQRVDRGRGAAAGGARKGRDKEKGRRGCDGR